MKTKFDIDFLSKAEKEFNVSIIQDTNFSDQSESFQRFQVSEVGVIFRRNGLFEAFGYKPGNKKCSEDDFSLLSKIADYLNNEGKTYDVHFNDSNDSNSKGFQMSIEEAKSYIAANNGSNESYFADYKKGSVSVVCNQTGEVVFETPVL